jgi:hypothetical protein
MQTQITITVLSRLLAGSRADAIRDHARGDISPATKTTIIAEVDDLTARATRGSLAQDPEKLKAWLEARHRSLPDNTDRRKVEKMLRQLSRLIDAHVHGYELGQRSMTEMSHPSIDGTCPGSAEKAPPSTSSSHRHQ